MIYLGTLVFLLVCMGLLDAKGKLFIFRHPLRGFWPWRWVPVSSCSGTCWQSGQEFSCTRNHSS